MKDYRVWFYTDVIVNDEQERFVKDFKAGSIQLAETIIFNQLEHAYIKVNGTYLNTKRIVNLTFFDMEEEEE